MHIYYKKKRIILNILTFLFFFLAMNEINLNKTINLAYISKLKQSH